MNFFSTPKSIQIILCGHVIKLSHFYLTIYIRFGTELVRQIVGIPMSTNCATFVTALFLFCVEGILLLRNEKLTMGKLKSSRLS